MITPGPSTIDAGAAPDGLVVHGYRIPDGVLVFTGALDGDSRTLEAIATDNADTAAADAPGGVVLVFYDGDSGERMWTQPALFTE